MAPQLADDPSEVAALDEFHRVAGDPVLRPDGEDGHDVRVPQAGRGLGLDVESVQEPRIERGRVAQDLEGHPPAQGHLDGLVDDAHPAPPQLAHHPEVAEVAEVGIGRRPPGPVGHHADGRQELAELVAVAVVEVDVVAAPQPLGEGGDPLGQSGVFAGRGLFDRAVEGIVHRLTRSPSPAKRERMRCKARRCRILAAPSPMSRIAAISLKLSSSR